IVTVTGIYKIDDHDQRRTSSITTTAILQNTTTTSTSISTEAKTTIYTTTPTSTVATTSNQMTGRKLFAIGGYSYVALKSVESYNFETEKWGQESSVPSFRAFLGAAT